MEAVQDGCGGGDGVSEGARGWSSAGGWRLGLEKRGSTGTWAGVSGWSE